MSTRTNSARPVRHAREITGLTWGSVPGQRSLPLFPSDWFECIECGHEAHVDSTPLPGELCWSCAEGVESDALPRA